MNYKVKLTFLRKMVKSKMSILYYRKRIVDYLDHQWY